MDSVLERDLRRSVQVLVDDNIQESLRGWGYGFCEQVYVEVVTHLDPCIQDRFNRECPSVRALQSRARRATTPLLGKLASSVSIVVILAGYLPVCVRLEYTFLRRPCRILEPSGSSGRVTCAAFLVKERLKRSGDSELDPSSLV